MMQASEQIRNLIAKAVAYKEEQEKRSISSKEMAERLDMKEARFSTYRTGIRIPPKSIAENMGLYFYASEKERNKFMAELNKARENKQGRATRNGSLDRLAAGEKLRVGAFKSEPFSGTKEAFFNQLLDRFFGLSGLNTVTVEPPGLFIDRALWDNALDLWLGGFARVDRSVLAHFLVTPMRGSLGAGILSKHEREKEWVRKVLSHPTL